MKYYRSLAKKYCSSLTTTFAVPGVSRPYVSEVDWINYRCILDIDGSVNAWGLMWRLGSGSVIMKVASNWTNAYINVMRPWVHYVPIKADLSDFAGMTHLVTTVEYSDLLQEIAKNSDCLRSRFTLSQEIRRVAMELQVFWRLRYTSSTSASTLSAPAANPATYSSDPKAYSETETALHVQFMHERVTSLLERLDGPRDLSRRFPQALRYSHTNYLEEFPEFVLNAFGAAEKSCFKLMGDPNHDISPLGEDKCPVITSVPRLPTLSSPLDNSTVLKWNSDLHQYFGPQNIKTIHALKEKYWQTASCSGSPRPVSWSSNREDCPRSRNLVLTTANRYHCNKIALYLRSLRDSNVCAKVVVITFEVTNRACQRIEDSCGGIETVSMRRDKYPGINEEVLRNVLALEYLNNQLLVDPDILCTQVLLTDFGDVYFQRNPFDSFLHKVDAEVIITEESFNEMNVQTTIATEPTKSNYEWFEACCQEALGFSLMVQAGEMPVLNSGQFYGSFGGIYKLLWVMAYVTDLTDARNKAVNSQGLLNFVYYTGLMRRVVHSRVLPPAVSVFLNGVYHHPAIAIPSQPYDFQRNPVVNELGEPYAVVHMYNRFHMMLIVEEWVLSYGGMDWRFKSVAAPKMCNRTIERR